jgi:hypothetical protein
MEGGNISGNTAHSGGGVNVAERHPAVIGYGSGIFIMTGGNVSGNTADSGGGVAISGNATFSMQGGIINDNTANGGGGVNVSGNGTFYIDGGTISDNTGRGIHFTSGNIIMQSGSIKGNTVGGVFINGEPTTFIMQGGSISGNTISDRGGGVNIHRGTFIMQGGTINGNTAFAGGGVGIGGGTFIMEGGSIFGNRAYDRGGGVFMFSGLDRLFIKQPPANGIGSGIIYGYDENDPVNSNVVKNINGEILNNRGNAVFLDNGFGHGPRRNTTVYETDNMDSSKDGAAGGWVDP